MPYSTGWASVTRRFMLDGAPPKDVSMDGLVVESGTTTIRENSSMSSTTDAAFADFATHETGDMVPFYEIEGQVIALWDQLNELELEQALLEAQGIPSEEELGSEREIHAQLEEAGRECLDVRATYMLRQSVVEDVLIADPILNAVHSGANATATERALHPLITRRDALSVAHINLSSSLQTILKQTAMVEAENVTITRQNRELTETLLSLTSKIQKQQDEAMADASLREQIDRARADTAVARRRRRIMKNVVAAIVAGSGVDWAHDEALQELVLDDEEEVDCR